MTSDSQRWAKLASDIAAGYIGDADVEGIVLGGSVARGLADANSDVDIFVFCRNFPSDDMRRSAIERVNGERWKPHNDRRDTGVLFSTFVKQSVELQTISLVFCLG
jgi:predicted nucleotidyltransferase